jgi:hypothetical protein
MKSYRDTYRKIIQGCAFAVLALLMGSCVNDQGDDVNCSESTLSLNLVVPQTTLTKALANDETSADAGEGVVHSLKIWIFRHGDAATEKPVAYEEFTSLERHTNIQNIVNLSMKVPTDLTTCDIYIQANSESISATLGANDTRTTLKAATFAAAPTKDNLEAKGLPMSRILENINVKPYLGINKTPIEVSLHRSVSKIGFYFSMLTGTKSVTIHSLTITNGLANQGSVFPKAVISGDGTIPAEATENSKAYNIPAGTTYSNVTFPYTGSKVYTTLPYSVIQKNDAAIERGATETAEAFKERLLAHSDLIEQAYFPEVDENASTFTITYSFDGESKVRSAEFKLGTGAIRNHEIIINGFFMNGYLYVRPTVLPWDNGSTTEFNLGNIITSFSSDAANKFIKDAEGNATDVATTYETTPTGNGHYAKFTFRFVSPAVNHWMLQLSNPAFGFKTNLNGDIVDFIDGAGGRAAVTFYVVPKNEYDALSSNDYGTKLYLTLPDYPNYGKIDFNPTGTGHVPSDANSTVEVNIRQVASVAAYEALQ